MSYIFERITQRLSAKKYNSLWIKRLRPTSEITRKLRLGRGIQDFVLMVCHLGDCELFLIVYTTMSYIEHMKRMFVNSALFTRIFDQLIASRKLLSEDFEEFERSIINNPQTGDVIPGLGGLRKSRVKSASKGKSGGFRVDYLDFPEDGITYYIVIYPKNVKSDLSSDEKKIILQMIQEIKRGVKNERNV